MREQTDAHFLHEKEGLDPVVSPPLDEVRALRWVPGKQLLLVATAEGVLAEVDPVMGTRTLTDQLGEVGAFAISPEGTHAAVVRRGAGVDLWELETRRKLFSVPHSLVAELWVDFWSGGIAMTGKGFDGGRVLVLDRQGTVKARGKLPKGLVVGTGRSRRLLAARVTPEGPEVQPLGKTFSASRTTGHRLRLHESGLLYGVAEGGITVWPGPGKPPRTIRGFNVTSANLSPDGKLVAMGMRDGSLVLTEVFADAPSRGSPPHKGGHDTAVRSLAFSYRGKWLATAAEKCWLWTWS